MANFFLLEKLTMLIIYKRFFPDTPKTTQNRNKSIFYVPNLKRENKRFRGKSLYKNWFQNNFKVTKILVDILSKISNPLKGRVRFTVGDIY